MGRSGIMLCYPFEEKRLRTYKKPYIIQPKLDGERCRAIFDDAGFVTLLSSEQNEIISVPHIKDQLESIKVANIELDGELYIHGLPFEEIHSRVSRRVELHHDYEQVEYHVFDVVANAENEFRMKALHTIFDVRRLPSVKMVRGLEAETLDDIMLYYDLFIKEGFEGFVIRNPSGIYVRKRTTNLMKFKPKKSDIYKIIDTAEEISIHCVPKGTLGALICVSDDNTTTFSIGTGFTSDQRRELWKIRDTLPGKWVEVQYQHITSGRRVPRFPVFSKIIDDLGGNNA